METIKYGEYEVNFDTLPAASQKALVGRGVTHFLGNEQASKIVAKIKREIGGENVTKEQVAAFREANGAKVAEWEAETILAALAALQAGTVGVRVGAPKGTTLDSVMRQVATEELKELLKNNKMSLPTGDKKLKFGDGQGFTREELIARRLANPKFRPGIEKEAKRRMSAAEKAAAELEV